MTTDAGLGAAQYVGLNLDVGRKAFSADGVVRLLGRMAELGFTALHLHLTETYRVGVRLPGFEELAAEDAWDRAEVARIVTAADAAGIALIPEIDLPSHAAALLAGREHLQLVDRDGAVHEDRLDISRPEALEFALALLGAAAELFPGEAIHLGGDEFFAAPWESEDAQHPERFPSLVEHARREVGPQGTALDSYALFVNALAARARDLGRIPMLWNDHVVPAAEHPLVPISRDVVLDVWIRWREWTPAGGSACSRTPSSRGASWNWPHRTDTTTCRPCRREHRARCSGPRCPRGATRPTCWASGRPSNCWTRGWCRSHA